MVEGTGKLLTAAAEGTPVKHSCWEPLNLRRREKEGCRVGCRWRKKRVKGSVEQYKGRKNSAGGAKERKGG